MPRHVFRFSPDVRNSVKQHVEKAIRSVDPSHYKQEAAYCVALAHALQGTAYDGPDGSVTFRSTAISDRGKGAAEKWSGADLAVTADVSDGKQVVQKAILIQAKRGALEKLPPREVTRLRGQIEDMATLTRSPKVMDIPLKDQYGDPGIYSGRLYLDDKAPSRYSLADYVVRRILTTLDGDTRPDFVQSVQDSDLTRLKVTARTSVRYSVVTRTLVK